MSLTVERLREVLDYDPKTGVFTWRIAMSRGIRLGALAGTSRSDGAKQIRIDRKLYLGHRLAWLYVHGVWPDGEIDHRHGKIAGDGISNLRDVTHAQNMHNFRQAKSDNKCGMLGVDWRKQNAKWRATIRCDGVKKHLGYFDSPEAAHAAYIAAKRQLHPFSTL